MGVLLVKAHKAGELEKLAEIMRGTSLDGFVSLLSGAAGSGLSASDEPADGKSPQEWPPTPAARDNDGSGGDDGGGSDGDDGSSGDDGSDGGGGDDGGDGSAPLASDAPPRRQTTPVVLRRRGVPPSATSVAARAGSAPPLPRVVGARGSRVFAARASEDGVAVNLDDCTAHAAARLLLHARTAVARFRSQDSLVTLRTRCVLLHRSPPPRVLPAGAVGPAEAAQLPQYYAAPTLVTLHVLHGQLWCSEARETAAGSPASTFQLLCGLAPGRASLEGTLVLKSHPQPQRKQRLVLTLRAHAPPTSGGDGAPRRVQLVLFPKDAPHLVQLATTLLYFMDPATAAGMAAGTRKNA
jgi:hypothetical protein